jgi:hypothetical protein
MSTDELTLFDALMASPSGSASGMPTGYLVSSWTKPLRVFGAGV